MEIETEIQIEIEISMEIEIDVEIDVDIDIDTDAEMDIEKHMNIDIDIEIVREMTGMEIGIEIEIKIQRLKPLLQGLEPQTILLPLCLPEFVLISCSWLFSSNWFGVAQIETKPWNQPTTRPLPNTWWGAN